MNRGLIKIRGAHQNNLKHISLDIPLNQLIVVTGVSGSGKSSLAFDIIAREGQRRYLETFSSFSRQFMGKISHPDVEYIEGLAPVITLSQRTVGSSSRSTVGTMSDLYDMLRLLFARLGQTDRPVKLSRSLFSFNTPLGACPVCNGLGLEEKISLRKLITNPSKSLREGAIATTQPNGYIMYSQVTVDVLNQLCMAHGFNTDIPWNKLTEDQQNAILYGSTLIKVPFGKHPLESRLKWTGITAKPREEDYYKGIITIMTDILRRDRNDSILRFVESVPCSACNGKRLNETALSVVWKGMSIDRICHMELIALKDWLTNQQWTDNELNIAVPVIKKMLEQINILINLGVGHLTLDRPAATLSGGESQRIRLVNQVYAELSNILYVFDEPTIGLHPAEKQPMLDILRILVNHGNTVIVVEHDETTIRQADWIIDVGPAAGEGGGNLLFNGTLQDFLQNKSLAHVSPTWDFLHDTSKELIQSGEPDKGYLLLQHCKVNNLKDIDVQFLKGKLNVVTGVSGSGKASLVHQLLEEAVKEQLSGKDTFSPRTAFIQGLEKIDKMITLNQAPIGRTPRSNPATYTGLSDKLRDLFARLPESLAAGFTKTHFSFNTAGGRCETCQGAGSLQIGMHFLGNVDVVCPACNGKRFHDDILRITFQGKEFSEVLELTVDEAIKFFHDQEAILRHLKTLQEVGLGYIQLGQSSSTLSGGEAQRVKLATELQQKDTGNTLYILDEPTTGLHHADIENLVKALLRLTVRGNTIICIEQDADIIRQADRVIELGPGSGEKGGRLLFEGTPIEMMKSQGSIMAGWLNKENGKSPTINAQQYDNQQIELFGVCTHQLKSIDVSFPKNKLTVITGLSGSGKTSLAFDTLFSEARSRFMESMSSYTRSLLKQSNPAQLIGSRGLGPVVAVSRKYLAHSSRSTVGTLTGLYDHYRLLYSRLSQQRGKNFTARHFSFNNELGACPDCDGLGYLLRCVPYKLITHPERSILEGAMAGHKTGLFYGDPYGQYIATLKEVARQVGIDLSLPWNKLSDHARKVILYGTGEVKYEVTWEFKNKTREGEHNMKSSWPGFCKLVDDEYQRKHLNKNTRDIEDLLDEIPCPACKGSRLKPELLEIQCYNKNIASLSALTFDESVLFFREVLSNEHDPAIKGILEEITPRILDLLTVLQELGLSYLTADRGSNSLSGGEGQRLRLAGALSAQLFSVTYVFDEPTIGLHAKDILPLVGVIKKLIANGNTAVVVEHDEQFIRQADHIIEMGPGAGQQGGNIIAFGKVNEIISNPASLTGQWLLHPKQYSPKDRPLKFNAFGVKGASKYNLKNIDVGFISPGIIAVTGVSGSGKSTLVNKVIYQSGITGQPVGCSSISGLEKFDRFIAVDQQPLSTHALSSPATYTGMMDVLRDMYANTPDARSKKLSKSVFSYTHKDGRCPDCNGYGQKRTSMDFMSDVWTPCDTCKGTRYQDVALEAMISGLNIAEVLEFTVDECFKAFSGKTDLATYLQAMQQVGIGHLKLGQPGDTLSGGESQRLRLASELIHHRKGCNLYIFDEPTTGLHALDIQKLIKVFDQLADEGHTILFIEHNPLLISIANQVITLGPGSGPLGGNLVNNL